MGVTGTVLANNLELREEPNTQSLVIDKLANGAIVQILRRSIDQSWLYVCCGSATKKQGWAKLEFIQINPRPVKLKPVPSAATSTATQQVTVTDGALTLAIQPTPTFVWQGQNLTLRFLIKNPSKRTLNNIRLRDDLPPELRFVTANVDHQGSLQQEGGPDGAIFTLFWPTLAAGAEVTAAVTVQIAPNTPNGALIKNLAVVNSQEVGNVVGGVSIVMPPVALPKF